MTSRRPGARLTWGSSPGKSGDSPHSNSRQICSTAAFGSSETARDPAGAGRGPQATKIGGGAEFSSRMASMIGEGACPDRTRTASILRLRASISSPSSRSCARRISTAAADGASVTASGPMARRVTTRTHYFRLADAADRRAGHSNQSVALPPGRGSEESGADV